jgi:hypothetical protein
MDEGSFGTSTPRSSKTQAIWGGLVALSVAISTFSPESPTGGSERVRLDAVRHAVDKTLGDMAQERRADEQAAELAAYETDLSAAHSEVLVTMHEFDMASQNLNCVRQQALAQKLEAQKAQGISFESALEDELMRLQTRWQEWRLPITTVKPCRCAMSLWMLRFTT